MDRCKISFDLTNQNGVNLYFILVNASVVLTILLRSPRSSRQLIIPRAGRICALLACQDFLVLAYLFSLPQMNTIILSIFKHDFTKIQAYANAENDLRAKEHSFCSLGPKNHQKNCENRAGNSAGSAGRRDAVVALGRSTG
jgi:hypothetical protein